MRIGVDCDGVMYDFVGALRHWLINHEGFSEERLPDATCWDFFKEQWGLTTQEFVDHCTKAVDAGFLFMWGEPIQGCVESLNRLKADGHTLHIVTNRSFGSRSQENTLAWLRKHDIPYDSLDFSSDKTKVPVDVFIDDSPENIEALIAAEVPAVIFDQTWNGNMMPPLGAQWWRAMGWWHVPQAISGALTNTNNGFLYQVRQPTETRFTDPTTGGQKGSKPEQPSMIPAEALLALSRIYAFGAEKYERFNYLKGYPWHLSVDAQQRHFLAWLAGEDIDPESGESHLLHAAWHLFALYMFQLHELGTDDRWISPARKASA